MHSTFGDERSNPQVLNSCLAIDVASGRPTYPKPITPACAFVSTANCLFAAGLQPKFVDIDLETLNLSVPNLEEPRSPMMGEWPDWYGNIIGIQFVATMGKPSPIGQLAAIADERSLYLIADMCEAHGATLLGQRQYADRYADAAIYSFYTAHLIVAGEGGAICTDDDDIAELCRSIKSHGRPLGDNFFLFDRIGFNAKWSDLHAAVALESLEHFDDNFKRRRQVRAKLLEALSPFQDRLILYPDDPGEVIAPHAFPVVLRDENDNQRDLLLHLRQAGIEVKTLFWSLPTQHEAFKFMGHKLGDFPVAESIGRRGLHFGCNEFMTDDDIDYIADTIRRFFT